MKKRESLSIKWKNLDFQRQTNSHIIESLASISAIVRNDRRVARLLIFAGLFILFAGDGFAQFDFKRELFGSSSTLSLSAPSVNKLTGETNLTGGDTGRPTSPFTYNWGDGSVTQGFFPQAHTYLDRTRNYIIKVTSHYSDGTTDNAETVAWFVAPQITPTPLPPDISVTIPDHDIAIVNRFTHWGRA